MHVGFDYVNHRPALADGSVTQIRDSIAKKDPGGAYSPAAFAGLIHTPWLSVVAKAAPTMPASARNAPSLSCVGTLRSSVRCGWSAGMPPHSTIGSGQNSAWMRLSA